MSSSSSVTTVVAVQSAAPAGQIGVVSTLPFFFRNIGATIGVAIMGAILNSHLTAGGGGPMSFTGAEGVLQDLPPLLRGHLAEGIRASFLFGLTAVALGIPVSLWVPDVSPARPATGATATTAPPRPLID